MEALGHGALPRELQEPARVRAGDAQGVHETLDVQPQRLPGTRRAAKDRVDARSVEPGHVLHVAGCRGACAAGNLVAHGESEQQCPAVNAVPLRQREDGGEGRAAGVAGRLGVGVVGLEARDGRAVDQGRIGGGGAPAPPEEGAGAVAAAVPGQAGDHVHPRHPRAHEAAGQAIQHVDLHGSNHRLRQVIEGCPAYKLRQPARLVHGSSRCLLASVHPGNCTALVRRARSSGLWGACGPHGNPVLPPPPPPRPLNPPLHGRRASDPPS